MKPLKSDLRAPAKLKLWEGNPRVHSPEQIEKLRRSIREFGFTMPILIDEKSRVIAGHGRLEAAIAEGMAQVPVIVARGWSEAQKNAYVVADNQLMLAGGWDQDLLRAHMQRIAAMDFDLGLTGFDPPELASLGLIGSIEGLGGGTPGEGIDNASTAGNLAAKFGIAPFSVLNARSGWWQDRKRAWLALGIQSEIGRGENLLKFSETMLEPDPEKRAKKKSEKAKAAA